VKKLISIGVALALVAIVVLPLGVAAQCPQIDYTYPTTYAKIPFAILESGLDMLSSILTSLSAAVSIPTWVPPIVTSLASWTGGPLSWTVDLLGWGLSLVGGLLATLASPLGLPAWLAPTVNELACAIFTPYSCNVAGPTFTPCG
jgi:hypothetical protein